MNHFSTTMFVFSPILALVLMALGIVAVVGEFLRPGSVFPGVVGSLLIVFGLHSAWYRPPAWSVALEFALPMVALLTFLLVPAWKAHRAKRRAIF